MNKTFIFDMDGVIINSESVWEEPENNFFITLLGEKNYLKIKNQLLGSTTNTIYELACQNGLKMDKSQFMKKYDDLAIDVYAKSELTKDIDMLIENLISLNFKLGLLTASRPLWIEQVLKKLKNKNAFECIISLSAREDLRPKPYPDGYLEVMKKLKSSLEKTIILEDLNKGIAAGKASGAFTICLRENLPKNYKSEGADLYANNLRDVITFVQNYE